MQLVKQIFTDLQATNGKKDKEKILQTHKNNTLLQTILRFVYDPMILSGLSSKKINKQVTLKPNIQIDDILNCLNYLSSHNTGTDQDICNIQSFVNSQHPEFQSLYIQIVTKSLKLGCDAKTMNKVFGKGFTDEQRDFYWNNPDKIIGKIIQVKYKEESKNKDGGLSLQFPIFECVRNDKTEPSYN